MYKFILTTLALFFFTGPSFATDCKGLALTCVLEQNLGDEWRRISESTAQLTMNPLHCAARLAIANPVETARTYIAVASLDYNVAIFTTVAGEVDYETGGVIGFANNNPLVMTYGNQKLSCKIQ